MKIPSRVARASAALQLAVALAAAPAVAQDERRELAQQLVNPLASLVSVPLQYNEDSGIGLREAERELLNLQPVVPFDLGARWKVISRTVVPFASQERGEPDGGTLRGMGDVTQSLFFTPKEPSAGGWLLGAGPVVQLPTGTDPRLSTERWSAGPTVVAVKQSGSFTYGGLANHLWSLAGDDRRPAVNATFLQPFLGYVTKTHTTIALNVEATYDWTRAEASVPLHLTVSQLLKIGEQPLSLLVAARYWAESPAGGPRGWGLRTGITLLFGRGERRSPIASRARRDAPGSGGRLPT